MKIYAGHVRAYSSKFEAVNFLLFLNPKGAENFRIWALKTFDRIKRYDLQAFQDHLSKIALAQNG